MDFYHAAGFFGGVSAVTSRCADGILQSRFLDKSCAAFLSAVTVPSIRFFHRYRGTALNSASRDRNIGGLAVFIFYFKACSVPDKRKRIPFAFAVRSRGVQPITPSRTRAVGKRDRRFAAIYAVLRPAECKDNAAEIFRLRYPHGACIRPPRQIPRSPLRETEPRPETRPLLRLKRMTTKKGKEAPPNKI